MERIVRKVIKIKKQEVLENRNPKIFLSKVEDNINDLISELSDINNKKAISDKIGSSLIDIIIYCSLKDIDFIAICEKSKEKGIEFGALTSKQIRKRLKANLIELLGYERDNKENNIISESLMSVVTYLMKSSKIINSTIENCINDTYDKFVKKRRYENYLKKLNENL